MEQYFYTAIHNDKEICKKSSSGGAFTAITDVWFDLYKDKAVVYGCVLDENLKAKHIRATCIEERNKMRGSKYIESDIKGISKLIENDLKNGLYVVFSGTPCQISGIKTYINNKEIQSDSRLLTIDLLCHGVAENSFFSDYITNLEKKYKGKATYCDFRAKTRAEALQKMQIKFDNGKVHNAGSTKHDWFYSAYLGNYVLKSACYECKFTSVDRVADFSLGDIFVDCPGRDREASSLIMVNTKLAEEFIGKISEKMNIAEVPAENVHKEQLISPAKKPENYDEFWSAYEKYGYLSAQKVIGNNTLKGRTLSVLVSILDRLNLIGFLKKIKRMILKCKN